MASRFDLLQLADRFWGFFKELQPEFMESFRQLNLPHYEGKQPTEVVSRLDTAVDRRFAEFLGRHFPSIPIVSEETPSDRRGTYRTMWLVDPLDGTRNILMGLPLFGSQVALVEDGNITFSAIFLPIEEAVGGHGFFFAGRGAGAWHGTPDAPADRLSVSKVVELGRAHVILGGPEKEVMDRSDMRRVAQAAFESRRGLSTSWTVTRIASGARIPASTDAVLNIRCVPYDILAGVLLVEEAGGRVTTFGGEPWSLENHRELVFSNGLLHEEIVSLLSEP